MSSFLLLLICLGLGVLFARSGRLPRDAPAVINTWIIDLALPALVMELLPKLDFRLDVWYLALSPWLVFIGSWLLFDRIGRRLHWSRGRIGAVVLTCGLGNTAFMGYPLIEALRGREAMGLAVLGDQLGTFIVLSTGAVVAAAIYAGREPHPRAIVRRVLTFPPFIGLVIGLIAAAAGGWPPIVDEVLTRLGSTLTPLALFSVGLQFQLGFGSGQRAPLVLGLGWKLMLAPLLVWLVGVPLGIRGLPLTVSVLEAAMAPMVSAGILAGQFGLDPRLANSIVGVGTLVSLLSVPLAHLLL